MKSLHGPQTRFEIPRRSVLAGCALLLLGCPSGSQRRGEGAAGTLLWVQVQALGQSAQDLHPLKRGESLSAGDRFGLLVESPQPRYLQLALLAPGDPTPTLWPPEEQAPPKLSAGQPISIPGATQWFRAEPRTGMGSLILVLSPQPLSPSALSALIHGDPQPPQPARTLAQAAAARQRDPAEWTAWTLPADTLTVRLPLPQR